MSVVVVGMEDESVAVFVLLLLVLLLPVVGAPEVVTVAETVEVEALVVPVLVSVELAGSVVDATLEEEALEIVEMVLVKGVVEMVVVEEVVEMVVVEEVVEMVVVEVLVEVVVVEVLVVVEVVVVVVVDTVSVNAILTSVTWLTSCCSGVPSSPSGPEAISR